jgi:hypothetical protein
MVETLMPVTVVLSNQLTTAIEGRDFVNIDDETVSALHSWREAALVSAIDPIGIHAVFNRIQIPQLLAELREVADDEGFKGRKEVIAAVGNFIEARRGHLCGISRGLTQTRRRERREAREASTAIAMN